MKVLVTGAGGMLAQAVLPALANRGHLVVPLPRSELDVTDELEVLRRLRVESPDVVVGCAAFTAVDAAEEDEEQATLVNGVSTRYLARGCQDLGARFVYPSTDYVFPGTASRPYRPEDPPRPINAYGRSKLAGEEAALELPNALVVRTSWLYGTGGANFVDTILRLARERERIDVVHDQIGRPTWTVPLAETIADLLERDAKGIFHATGAGGPASWYDVATRIVARAGLEVEVRAVTTSEFPRPAPRPGFSVLDCAETEAVIGRRLPRWEDSLHEYLR
jgi:dTDP-4-dehydrorhamnose reductase